MNIVDYYMNTIDDMQNERKFFYHCKEFEYRYDFVLFFSEEIVYDPLEFGVLDSNV